MTKTLPYQGAGSAVSPLVGSALFITMEEIDHIMLDIVKSRARWDRKVHMRISEIQALASSRFPGCNPSGDTIVRSIDRLVRRRQLRWCKVKDDDVWVLP